MFGILALIIKKNIAFVRFNSYFCGHIYFLFNIQQVRLHFDSPQVMGILNLTPDSFYSGSRKQTEQEIAERVRQIIAEGGSMIDVGAFSTRPGAPQVSEEEELQRMRRGLNILRNEMDGMGSSAADVLVSIDTFRPSVARMAVEEFGADIINDVSEGGITGVVDTPLGDLGLFHEVARLKVPYILMSVQPTMETMKEHFRSEIEQLQDLGVEDIILDPGYGFGKDIIKGNYDVLARQQELKDEFGLPLLVGVSRKRMIWQLSGTSADEALNGTTAINMLALERGADILRVHDVKEAVETVKIFGQLKK